MDVLVNQGHSVSTEPFDDQKPGTSGLRKKVARFQEKHYVENFIQSIFDTLPELAGGSLVIGGDGRYFNDQAIQTIIQVVVANGVEKLIIGKDGLLSTPAAAHLIRHTNSDAGIILSASHNPGGPEGDFGIKLNMKNGGPSPQSITDAIYENTKSVRTFKKIDCHPVDLASTGQTQVGPALVEVIDPVQDYADLMETQFDFDAIRQMPVRGIRMVFDAMSAVTGPYACEIFENRLGFPSGTVINAQPLKDFGGGHPDPNPVHAHELFELMMSDGAPEFGAASDGDGDRNLIVGRSCPVSPSDSLALLAANAHLVPAFSKGLAGIARSMPTSSAVDRVAEKLGVPLHVTPTGWKFFGNLMDAGLVNLCGEESAGTGGAHVREKDGIWAVLFWLNILAVTGKSVQDIMTDHWQTFGRTFYQRHDFEGLDETRASEFFSALEKEAGNLVGRGVDGLTVVSTEVFEYKDPTTNEIANNQGVQLFLDGHSRLVFRLSGTGTTGATLRVYLERLETRPEAFSTDVADSLSGLTKLYQELLNLKHSLGVTEPTTVV